MPLNRSVGFLLQRIPQTRRDTHEIKDKQSTCFAWYRSCVSHSAAIFLQTCRTPQKHCELLSSSLRGPGRTCLFVQEQWIRKKRSSATARNSKSPPILQSSRSVSDTRFKIGSELAWSYGRGAQITAQKPDVARQNNPSSISLDSFHLSWGFWVLRIFFRDLKFCQNRVPDCCTPLGNSEHRTLSWDATGAEDGHREPQFAPTTSLLSPIPTGNTAHCLISSSTPYQTNPTWGCKHTHQPCKGSSPSAAAADGNMKQSGQLRKARRESCSAFLCLPAPHEDLLEGRGRHPSGCNVCSQQ